MKKKLKNFKDLLFSQDLITFYFSLNVIEFLCIMSLTGQEQDLSGSINIFFIWKFK